MESLIGRSISHYSILRRIGAGGMGVVYEAEDTNLQRRVAIKILPSDVHADELALERLRREARTASALNHPGICTVHTIDQHEGRPFIVMELVGGETLASRLRGQRLGLDEVLDLSEQIADALETAHAQGIVHRDLKPGNVMLNERGRVKILDFGLAKLVAPQFGPSASTEMSQLETLAEPISLTVPGTVLGTMHYMSPEQARGEEADTRSDLFSLGTMIYEMATGRRAFAGETHAIVFDALLNRDPPPIGQLDPAIPSELGHIIEKALEKSRELRYQTATEVKTDLIRIQRKRASTPAQTHPTPGAAHGDAGNKRSVAVLYFENLSGAKEDEYFRDGMTEDVVTELSKIEDVNTFPRPAVLQYRDRPLDPGVVGRQLGASYVLSGSLRKQGDRLRINVQLIDSATDFPLWSERYDRELQDVFTVQDDIAHHIADALRIKLTAREKEALAANPTDDPKAYDQYLRGRAYARRRNRRDMDFAIEHFENAIRLDPRFALAHASIAIACADVSRLTGHDPRLRERAREAAARAFELQPDLPEAKLANAWIHYVQGDFDSAIRWTREIIAGQANSEGAYHLLLRSLYNAGRMEECAELAETAVAVAGSDYNIYPPLMNALGALGRKDAARNLGRRTIQVLQEHVRDVPEDARARSMLGSYLAEAGRAEEALREIALARSLRPDEALILYNAACAYCTLGRKPEALEALASAWQAGFRDAAWTRNDPDLQPLHGDPEFDKLFPETESQN